MATYILVDFMNLAFRAGHTVQTNDVDMKTGLAMHTMFASLRKVTRMFPSDNVVFCLEGRSYRKDVYPEYKMGRKVKQLEKSVKEQEDTAIFLEGLNTMAEYLVTRTNATALQCPVAEADDMIATWIDMHPNDKHIINSTDSDFHQLLAPNVDIYNGVTEEHITLEGFFNEGNLVIDKKTGLPKAPIDPEYSLFKKIIRGDSSDSIMSAFPGVREKDTKAKVGIIGAFEDRHAKGYKWNNFMMQRFTDRNDVEHRVLDRYNENKSLIDLREQPDEIKLACINTVLEAVGRDTVRDVGFHFMKFCKTWELTRLSQYPDEYAKILNSRYKGDHKI